MMRFTWLIGIFVLSLFLAACAGNSESPTSSVSEQVASSNDASEEETVEMESAEEAIEEKSIVDIAADDGRFTTLVAAVQVAGLAETLSGDGKFTVFAPTDEAFAGLPEGTVEALLEDPRGDLTNILLYHVVEGAVPVETVVTLNSAATLQGSDVTISVGDDGVMLNDNVKVIITDVVASNGIIHVIDDVLHPSAEQANTAQTLFQMQARPSHAARGSNQNA